MNAHTKNVLLNELDGLYTHKEKLITLLSAIKKENEKYMKGIEEVNKLIKEIEEDLNE